MDEVIIKGIKYISSKRAAKTTGYAKDYVGQLVRLGKLKAIKVGRSWFIEERAVLALTDHTANQHGLANLDQTQQTELESMLVKTSGSVVANVKFPATWSEVTYLEDKAPLFANSDSRDELISSHGNDVENSSSQDESVRVSIRASRVATARPFELARGISARSMDGIRISVHESRSNVAENVLSDADFEAFKAFKAHGAGLLPVSTVRTQQAVRVTRAQQFLRILVSATLVAAIGLLIPILS